VMIAKRLVPYVGYVGAAIAWSWSAIRGYDKGSVATPELERAYTDSGSFRTWRRTFCDVAAACCRGAVDVGRKSVRRGTKD
jgi:hypothetical protein